MFFSLKFNVWLEWKDERLSFQNLKKDYFLNKITDDTAMDLWTPKPAFENNLDRPAIRYDPSSSVIFLARNGTSFGAKLSQLDEAMVYNSSETKLRMKTCHFMSFKCHFNLNYFPFDHQTCYIEVCYKF